MVGELITLPLRMAERVARLSWRAADQATSLGWSAAGYLLERMAPVGADSPPVGPSETVRGESAGPTAAAPSATAPSAATPSATATSATSPASRMPKQKSRPRPIRPPEPQPASPAEEPTHVSEEPTLVEELAEPGAEDGAGAELHIHEPWAGYRRMSAREVTARLSEGSDAELAAVQLYESTNRNRQTILSAVARQLKGMQHHLSGANGSGRAR